MSDPILSPDGRQVWNGSNWVPRSDLEPQQEPQQEHPTVPPSAMRYENGRRVRRRTWVLGVVALLAVLVATVGLRANRLRDAESHAQHLSANSPGINALFGGADRESLCADAINSQHAAEDLQDASGGWVGFLADVATGHHAHKLYGDMIADRALDITAAGASVAEQVTGTC